MDQILQKHKKNFQKFSQDLVLREIIREIINEMVKDIILNIKKKLKDNNIKNINDVYESKFPLVKFSKKMKIFDFQIKEFLKKRMYLHKRVLSKTRLGKRIVKNLFVVIKKRPDKFINIRKIKKSDTNRIISDFIAGMTDRFAINLYNKSK